MVKKLLMLTGGLGLMLFFTEQYMQPTIDNSMRALQDMVRCGVLFVYWREAGTSVGRLEPSPGSVALPPHKPLPPPSPPSPPSFRTGCACWNAC